MVSYKQHSDHTNIFPFFLQILIHPNFNKLSKMDSDIALLRLGKSVPLGPERAIVPICLPTEDEDFSGHIGTVSGWGSVSSCK